MILSSTLSMYVTLTSYSRLVLLRQFTMNPDLPKLVGKQPNASNFPMSSHLSALLDTASMQYMAYASLPF